MWFCSKNENKRGTFVSPLETLRRQSSAEHLECLKKRWWLPFLSFWEGIDLFPILARLSMVTAAVNSTAVVMQSCFPSQSKTYITRQPRSRDPLSLSLSLSLLALYWWRLSSSSISDRSCPNTKLNIAVTLAATLGVYLYFFKVPVDSL